METFKIVLVIGTLSAAVAVGLALLFGAITGKGVTEDEIARNVIMGFLVATVAIVTLRRGGRTPK